MSTVAAPAPTRRETALRFLSRVHEPTVPRVALTFWLVKLLTTGMGEAVSDWIAGLGAGVAAAGLLLGGLVLFAVVFTLQLRATEYHPVRYWGTVALVAVYGTMAADVVHVALGNTATTLLYAALVAAVLTCWRRQEGSISIHSVTPPRRELYYWATVGATFALGTALGDLAAETLGLGYATSALVFAALMLLLVLAWRGLRLPAVPVFWAAYALTRPLGASLADWVGKPTSEHGLGVGDGTVSLLCLAVFAGVLLWLQLGGRDRPAPATS